jgi:hypothetical protein
LGEQSCTDGTFLATFGGGNMEQVEELSSIAKGANETLHEILGPSAGLVSAEWERAEDDRGRMVVTLTLSDFTGRVSATFAPDELSEKRHLAQRFRRLWGDLLQLRTKRLRDDLTSPFREEVG